jgi:hypothetical protein
MSKIHVGGSKDVCTLWATHYRLRMFLGLYQLVYVLANALEKKRCLRIASPAVLAASSVCSSYSLRVCSMHYPIRNADTLSPDWQQGGSRHPSLTEVQLTPISPTPHAPATSEPPLCHLPGLFSRKGLAYLV